MSTSSDHTGSRESIHSYAKWRLCEDLFGGVIKQSWLDEKFVGFLQALGLSPPGITPPIEITGSNSLVHDSENPIVFDALLDSLLTKYDDDIYSMPLFTNEFCDLLVAEIRNIYKSGVKVQQPNSMNRYGVVLNQIGMEPLMTAIQKCIQSTRIAQKKYAGIGSNWDGHHSFIVEYAPGKDLGLDMHRDDADVTLNICLGIGNFVGSQVAFWDAMGGKMFGKGFITYEHKKGRCLMHLGSRQHGALHIRKGERMNLIIWNRSSTWKRNIAQENSLESY